MPDAYEHEPTIDGSTGGHVECVVARGCATVLAAMLTTFVDTGALDSLRRRAKAGS